MTTDKMRMRDSIYGRLIMPGPEFAYIVSSLPLFGLMFCVALSCIKDFDESTNTHCLVYNFLPSISSAIGGFTPQKYIWQFCIALHAGPRLLTVLVIYHYFTRFNVRSPWFHQTVMLTVVLHTVEIASLLVLSFVTSSQNYYIHEKSFITFISIGIISMILQLVLRRWCYNWTRLPNYLHKQWIYQLTLFSVYIFLLFLAAYLFLRHNHYCEPYVYSLFALSEYLIVVTNIWLNCQFALDFLGEHDIVFEKIRMV